MNLEDSLANKIYWLYIAEVLARDIFMSQPALGMFPCRGISKLCYLSCLVFLMNYEVFLLLVVETRPHFEVFRVTPHIRLLPLCHHDNIPVINN